MNQVTRWLATILGMLTLSRISNSRKELIESDSSLDRSGSLTGSEGCLTPRSLRTRMKLLVRNKKRESQRRRALLQLEEEYRRQEEMLWENSGAVWQRSILMGEKCEPPDFSGLILYDERGNRVPEFPPKSPRAGPLVK